MTGLSAIQCGDRAFEFPRALEQKEAVDKVVAKLAHRILECYFVVDEWRGGRSLLEREVASLVDAIVFHMEEEPDPDLCREIDELIRERPDGSRNHLLKQLEQGVADCISQCISPDLLRK